MPQTTRPPHGSKPATCGASFTRRQSQPSWSSLGQWTWDVVQPVLHDILNWFAQLLRVEPGYCE
jgi:hypothetical protein